MPFIIGLTLLTTVVATWGILKAASRRRDLAGAFLGLILVAATWWALCHVMETQPVAIMRREVWGGPLKYIGLLAMGPALLLHGLHFSGRGHLVTRKLCLGLLVVPSVILTVLTVPSWRHLVRDYPDGSDTVVLGPLYLIVPPHLLITAGLGLWLSAQQATRTAKTPAQKAGIVALFAGAGLVTILQIFTGAPFAWFNPAHTTVAGLVIAALWAIISIRNHQQVVDAEETLEKLAMPLLLTDANRIVRDANPAAVSLLGPRQDLLGRQLHQLLPGHPSIAPETPCDGSEAQKVIKLATHGKPHHWLVQRQAFLDTQGTPKADMVSFADVSTAIDSSRRTDGSAASSSMPKPRQWPDNISEIFAQEGVEVVSRAVVGTSGERTSTGAIYNSTFRVDDTIWIVTGRVRGSHATATDEHAVAMKVTLETLLKRGTPAVEICRWLHGNLPFTEAHRYYVSAALIGINVGSPEPQIQVTLAGHAPAHLVRDGKLARTLGEDSPALSLASDDYATESMPLDAGDRIVVVDSNQRTDLTESQLKVAVTQAGPGSDLAEVSDNLVQHYGGKCPGTTVLAIDFHGVPKATQPVAPTHDQSTSH